MPTRPLSPIQEVPEVVETKFKQQKKTKGKFKRRFKKAAKRLTKSARQKKTTKLIQPESVCVACATYDEGQKCPSCEWKELEGDKDNDF